jgi:hypothetical protein
MEDKPLLFRFHRGGLDESLATVIKIDSFEQLLVLLVDAWAVPFHKVSIEEYGFDDRIDWDTHSVRVFIGDIGYVAGFLNRKPDWSVKDYE